MRRAKTARVVNDPARMTTRRGDRPVTIAPSGRAGTTNAPGTSAVGETSAVHGTNAAQGMNATPGANAAPLANAVLEANAVPRVIVVPEANAASETSVARGTTVPSVATKARRHAARPEMTRTTAHSVRVGKAGTTEVIAATAVRPSLAVTRRAPGSKAGGPVAALRSAAGPARTTTATEDERHSPRSRRARPRWFRSVFRKPPKVSPE